MMNPTISMRLAPVACAAGLLLGGCGGGGGGDAATPGFEASNYRAVAEPVAASVLTSVGVSGVLGGGSGTERLLALRQGAQQPDPVALLKRWGALAASAREQAQQVQSISEPCPGGGSLTGTANIANANAPTPGDTLSITAINNCVIDGVALAGGLDITVRSYSVTGSSDTGNLALNFRGFSAAGATVNGGATLSFNANDSRADLALAFTNATVTAAGSTVTLNYTTTITAMANTSTIAIAGGLSLNGHDYTLTQPAAFTITGAGLDPGGTLQVQEALGARLLLVSDVRRFTYRYFSPANRGSTPDATSTSVVSF